MTRLARSNMLLCRSRPVTAKYEGTVLGLGIDCFGELSAGINDVFTFIARNREVPYVDRYDDKSPREALGPRKVLLKGPPRVGSCGHFRLERPHFGLQPQSPAACATRAGGDPGPNFENYVFFHAQFPDTSAHARSWRVNWDVDVRRRYLGFCLRVYLLALLLDGPYEKAGVVRGVHTQKPKEIKS